MCLSTPVATAASSSTSTNATTCNATGNCLSNNSNNNNNNINGKCTLNTERQHCDDTNNATDVCIRNRLCTINNNVQFVASEAEDEPIDVIENLGYKEENAVYKEIPIASETSGIPDYKASSEIEYNPQIRWLDLIAQVFLHGGALYGVYLLFQAKFYTLLWGKQKKF